MTKVKICGNTDTGQVEMCVRAGADAVGFVVEYPVPVPWNLAREEAAGLLAAVPPFVSRVVVTGGAAETVIAIADFLSPDVVQLHTDNSIAETALVSRELTARGIGLVRALRIDVGTGETSGEIPDPIEAALALQGTGIRALLVDARTDSMPAGTGVSVSWDLARRIREAVRIPLILAGGLNAGNVREAIEAVRPYAVDVISGVELSRRVKDPALVEEFVRQVRESC